MSPTGNEPGADCFHPPSQSAPGPTVPGACQRTGVKTMIDFHTQTRTMRLTDPEDRALLGSNPSAAVGDGDIVRSSHSTAAPVSSFFADVLVRKAINPSSFLTTQLWRKPISLTRPVCHLARYSWARKNSSVATGFYRYFVPTGLAEPQRPDLRPGT